MFSFFFFFFRSGGFRVKDSNRFAQQITNALADIKELFGLWKRNQKPMQNTQTTGPVWIRSRILSSTFTFYFLMSQKVLGDVKEHKKRRILNERKASPSKDDEKCSYSGETAMQFFLDH